MMISVRQLMNPCYQKNFAKAIDNAKYFRYDYHINNGGTMTPEQLKKRYGGWVEAAHAIGYTTEALYHWRDEKRIPVKAQRMIELLTGGALKADRVKK